MDEKLSIRVNIIDRYYPLKIDRADEEKIRKAGKIINDKVLQYKQKYADKDVQDFLAMAALQYVTRLLELENQEESHEFVDSIKELNEELEDYLREEGLLAEVQNVAIKRVIAWQLQEEMKKKSLTKTALAQQMKTSRAALERLLDPENTSTTLESLQKAAKVLGKQLKVELV